VISAPDPAESERRGDGSYSVDAREAMGVQVGEGNTQIIYGGGHAVTWLSTARSRALITGGVTMLIAGTWWLLAEHSRGAQIATDIATPISLLGLAAAVFGVALRPRIPDHQTLVRTARHLAHEVATREAVEQLKLLAEAGGGRPADVTFAMATVAVSWRSDGGRQHGSLTDIADFYGGLKRGRLVVLGEAGSGKTVLVEQLLLDLIERLPENDPAPGHRRTVPVRLSLPSFDPGSGTESIDGAAESLRLTEWLVRHLIDVYGIPAPTASALLVGGWILPILDGLDEMDPAGGPALKAAAVMRALNYPVGTGPRPVVLTCRTSRYRELAATPAPPGRIQVLQDATAVDLEPLSVDQVIAYLTQRFPDSSHPSQLQPRWRPVTEQLRSPERQPLAHALQSPLRLFVAVTAYNSADPSELLRVPGGQLDHHLFSSLIPAVVEQHPGPGGALYGAEEVTRWLTTIAEHLHQRSLEGGSESDLDLHLFWTAAGRRAPRYLAAAGLGTCVAASLVAPYLWYIHTLRRWLPINVYGWALIAIAATLLVLTVRRAVSVRVDLQRFDFESVRTAPGRRRVGKWILRWSAFGLLFGAVFGLAYGLSFGLAFGIAFGAAFGISFGLEKKPSITGRPGALVSEGVAHDVVVIIAFACSFGLANGFANGLIKGLAGGITFGLAFGLSAGVVFISKSPWPRYLMATQILARRGVLASRPAVFLDWAYAAGLLRQSGISTQFRHRELQRRLMATPPEPTEALLELG
jgi:hypothetical protein